MPATAAANEEKPATRFAKDQLKAVIERIERLEEEKKATSDDIRDVYAEAKGNGFDIKALRSIVRLRKLDTDERREQQEVLETYMHALGMVQWQGYCNDAVVCGVKVAVARNTTALPQKRSVTMPSCGSAEKLISTDCAGLRSRSCSQAGLSSPSRVDVMKSVTLGVSMAARSQGLSERWPPIDMSGAFTATVVLAAPGITVASRASCGTRSPIGRTRVAGAGAGWDFGGIGHRVGAGRRLGARDFKRRRGLDHVAPDVAAFDHSRRHRRGHDRLRRLARHCGHDHGGRSRGRQRHDALGGDGTGLGRVMLAT